MDVLEAVEAGVEVPDCEGFTSVSGFGSSAFACIGEALRLTGGSSCNVDDSDSLSSATVVEGSSGLPSMMRRTSVGSVVEAERNSRILETVWTGRMLSLMAVVEQLAARRWE